MGDGGTGAAGGDGANRSHVLFDNFVQASTCKGTLKAFQELCDHLEVKPTEYRVFYHKLKSKLNYWKAKALWAKLDKRASHKEYKKGRACANSKVSRRQHKRTCVILAECLKFHLVYSTCSVRIRSGPRYAVQAI